MQGLADEIRIFKTQKASYETSVRQMAAFFLVSGVDLPGACNAQDHMALAGNIRE